MHHDRETNSNESSKTRGFTLIETAVTVGVFAMLASIVINGISPLRQIMNTRNAQRLANLRSVQAAVDHYALDTFGGYPPEIDTKMRMIGTAESGCSITCGPDSLEAVPMSFTDEDSAVFGNGSYSDTQWDASSNGIILNANGLINKIGTYISETKDAGDLQNWTTISWIPWAPYGKELPAPSTTVETGYPSGNINMANTALLMHLNDTGGAIVDVSGNGNNGVNMGGLTYNVSGKLKTSMSFNGGGGYFQVNSSASLNLPASGGAVMLWIKPTVNLPQDTGMGIIRKPDYAGNVYGPGGYGLEIYRWSPGGPQTLKGHLGRNNGNSYSVQTVTGTTSLVSGQWYHVVLNWTSNSMSLYLNGALDATAYYGGTLTWQNGAEKLYVGHLANSMGNGRQWFKGQMDEIALFRRTLQPSEILAAYQRGAYNLKLQVRGCNTPTCSGATFVGPDNTSNTYFSEENNSEFTPPPPMVISPNLGASQFLQYKAFLTTDSSSAGPILQGVTITNDGLVTYPTPTTEQTAGACIDLGTALFPTYITGIPFDPQNGSAEKTYYAIKKKDLDNIVVRACTPEFDRPIELNQ